MAPWLADNLDLTRELLNRRGYWLFPKSIELPLTLVAGKTVPLTLAMENRGGALSCQSYELCLCLSGAGGWVVCVLATRSESWLPSTPVASTCAFAPLAELEFGD